MPANSRTASCRPTSIPKPISTPALAALGKADPRFTALVAKAGRPPLRRRADGFAGLAAIIVAQQLSTASANAIWGRLAAAFDPLDPAAILRARPARLRRLGLSAAKIRTLKAIARAVCAKSWRSPRSTSSPPTRRTPRSPRCTASDPGPPTFICCLPSVTPTLGRRAIWRCRKRRRSPSRCRRGRPPRRCRHWRSRGGRGALSPPASCGRIIVPRRTPQKLRRLSGQSRSQTAAAASRRRRASLHDQNAARRLVEIVEKLLAAGRQRADVDDATSLPAATTFSTRSETLSNSIAAKSRFLTCSANGLLAGACTSAG